jgi:4-amino-4-deoxy-L-arabinose transferase-like glycosyltransferase
MKVRKVILIVILLVASFLRLWKLSEVPVSLFGDEVDVGYQAYSVLKTGKDYYGNFLPIHFHSLAEWRTPLYLYSAVPTVAAFGVSPLGVRLPAAIFGILGVWIMYLLVREITKNENLGLLSAFLLAISPWHIQYSRAGFEVTQLILFLLLGLFFFYKSLSNGKFLWLSLLFFALTPWIYSTAKLFTPLIMLFLLIMYWKNVFSLPKKNLIISFIVLLVVGVQIAWSTLFGGGSQRFDYVGIFTDPTMESEVGTARLVDARARGEKGTGLNPTLIDRVIHNKFTFVGDNLLRNYLQPFSFDFLFNNGDPNPRHSIHQMGELYKVEAIALILGLILFFSSKSQDRKFKALIAFWILAGVIPAALTRDGGNHATRLVLILPPLILLISFGCLETFGLIAKKYRLILLGIISFLYFLCIFSYLHNYYVHNPNYSERWWHYGFKEGITYIKENQKDYDKVIISTAGEPPWIFFAGFYQYDPALWQKNFPIGNDVEVPGIGKVSHIDKFYFGSPSSGVYDWGNGAIDSSTLYLATAKEVNVNLIQEPGRTPGNLTLLKAISYPSGEPAFYLFTGKK